MIIKQSFNPSFIGDDSYHSDALSFWIFIASLFHAIILIGVNFASPEPKKVSKAIEITLVNSVILKVPPDAKYLAQENQMGAGLKKQKPKLNQQKIPNIEQQKQKQKPKKTQNKGKKKQKKGKHPPSKKKKSSTRHVISQKKKPKKVIVTPKKITPKKITPKKITPKKITPKKITPKKITPKKTNKPPKLSRKSLNKQIAQLGERVKYLKQSAKKTTIKFVNSISTHKYIAAQYVRDWERKIERIGNLNYPKIARKKGFSGTLSMDVGIKSNGTIYRIRIVKSSGNKTLDDAAKRIVRMSAPFSRLPRQISNQLDVLVIRRVWSFTDESRFVGR